MPSRSGTDPRQEDFLGTFIKAHLGAIAAADFFTAEVVSFAGLVRYHVFFIIDSRRVEIPGPKADPDGCRMQQIARNLTDLEDGFLLGKRYLVLDRDPLYTRSFAATLKSAGVKALRLPPRSPDLNAFAERFVLSIKTECLSRIVPLGEQHLRRAVAEFAAHYHCERNHQGLANELISLRTEVREHGRQAASAPTARRLAQFLSSSGSVNCLDGVSAQDGL